MEAEVGFRDSREFTGKVDAGLDLRKTDAAAHEPAPAVLVADVDQHVGHCGPGLDASVGVDEGFLGRVFEDWSETDFVDACTLSAKLAFDPEQAEVVTADQGSIESSVIFDLDGPIDRVGRVVEIIFRVLDKERAEIHADIGGSVASNCRGCDRGRGNRGKQVVTH